MAKYWGTPHLFFQNGLKWILNTTLVNVTFWPARPPLPNVTFVTFFFFLKASLRWYQYPYPQVLMVTGGSVGVYSNNFLDSTELLRPDSGWQEITARLPRQMSGVRVNTVDNRVILSGEWLKMIILLHFPHTGPLCYRGIWWRYCYKITRLQYCYWHLGIHTWWRLEENRYIEGWKRFSWRFEFKDFERYCN